MLQFVAFLVLVVPSYQACRSCDTCSSVAANDSSLCKCDADCGIFGDCCGSVNPPVSCSPPSLDPLLPGAELECQPIYLNASIPVISNSEGYLMVSSCPTSYVEVQETDGLAGSCTSKDILLPPVTDLNTGIVYRNEYCAYCNEVEELVTWQIDLTCTDEIDTLLTCSNFSTVSVHNWRIFHRECQESRFRVPSLPPAVKHPRSCILSIDSCLPKSKMKDVIGPSSLVEHNCSSGVVDQAVGTDGLVYKNSACARCNTVNVSHCLNAQNKSQLNKYAALNTSTAVEENNTRFIVSIINGTTISISEHYDLLLVMCSGVERPLEVHCEYTDYYWNLTWNKSICSDFMTTIVGSSSNSTKCISKLLTLNNYTFPINNESLDCWPTSDCEYDIVPLDNGNIFSDGINKTVTLYYDSNFNLYTCSSYYYKLVLYIGSSLSMAGVTLTIITYSLFRELRTLPSTVLLNIALSVFLERILLLLEDRFYGSENILKYIALFLYVELVKRTWIVLFSYETLRKFYKGMKVKSDSKQSKIKHLVIYIFIGWFFPAIIVSVTYIVGFTVHVLEENGINSTEEYRIIENKSYTALAFYYAILFVISIVTFCISSCCICGIARQKFKVKKTINWSLIRLWLAVLSASGLLELLTIVVILAVETKWLVHFITLCIYSEGLFIFIAFFLTKKVITLYCNFIFCKGSHDSVICCSKHKSVVEHPDNDPETKCFNVSCFGYVVEHSSNNKNSMETTREYSLSAQECKSETL